MPEKNFASRLAELRKERGISQEALAGRINSRRTTVAGFEKENKEPSYDMLCRIADFFDVSVDYLIGHFDSRTGSDDVLFSDNRNLKKHYEALPAELRPVVSKTFDSFYVLLLHDMQTGSADRLKIYENLFGTLCRSCSDIKKAVANLSAEGSATLLTSNLIAMQNNLKSEISAELDMLLQTDLAVAAKPTYRKAAR